MEKVTLTDAGSITSEVLIQSSTKSSASGEIDSSSVRVFLSAVCSWQSESAVCQEDDQKTESGE